jgi:hypothetical protein
MPMLESESAKSEPPQSSGKRNGVTSISGDVAAKNAGAGVREMTVVDELATAAMAGAISDMAKRISGGNASEYGRRIRNRLQRITLPQTAPLHCESGGLKVVQIDSLKSFKSNS